jgi:hypothetical protein
VEYVFRCCDTSLRTVPLSPLNTVTDLNPQLKSILSGRNEQPFRYLENVAFCITGRDTSRYLERIRLCQNLKSLTVIMLHNSSCNYKAPGAIRWDHYCMACTFIYHTRQRKDMSLAQFFQKYAAPAWQQLFTTRGLSLFMIVSSLEYEEVFSFGAEMEKYMSVQKSDVSQ